MRTKADSYYGPGIDNSGHSEISLRNLKGSHRTSISAAKALSRRHDDDKSHFIRLDESVEVDVSPRGYEEGFRWNEAIALCRGSAQVIRLWLLFLKGLFFLVIYRVP